MFCELDLSEVALADCFYETILADVRFVSTPARRGADACVVIGYLR